jgi:hypothetical protein
MAVTLVVAITLAGAAATTSAADETTPQPLAFGAYAQRRAGQSERAAVEALEAQIGRSLEVVRVFETWEQQFPDSYHTWLRDSGHSIILSIKPRRSNGSTVSWSSIANATPGSPVDLEIRSWARRIKNYGVPLQVTLHHEPESGNNGLASDYIAAWRHWVDVFREEGVTNADFMWILTSYAFRVSPSDRRYAPEWYPGDAWVDAIAADAYNWYSCRDGINTAWKSLEQLIEPVRAFGALHPDKSLWLAEYASAQDPARPDRRGEWIDDVRELFKQPGWEQFDGILYFNTDGRGDCVWFTDGDAGTLERFRAMAQDPFYAGPAFEEGQATTTSSTSTTTSSTTTTVEPTTTTTTTTTVEPTTTSTTTTTTITTTVEPTTTTTESRRDSALLVVGSTTLNAGDLAARDRLTAAGYTVHVLDDNVASPNVVEDLVLISSSVSSGTVAGTYRQTPVPVLLYKPWIYDDMAMVSAYGASSGRSVTISNSASPLAADLTGTVSVTSRWGSIGWGSPAASAEVVATASGRAALFAYVTGDLLADGTAAESCRLALPFSHNTLATATAQGNALLDAAIAWASSC